ncbi:aspartyl protease [Candidatus Shapirobacteria bacterium CG08_land_8_20_14_0_20_39_18]|uniref:Aspartyl protease n=1 Tax=Candidatus Shapirobacteria bacterium CG08_land_8_20_14_0_20_39_18 TaxID=1974883 RepID=A0A2M6XCH1_9BACT|nr:MAG: aspartyl protease [Candidatus Shapirobacteria bacterium CG08_land_8_20_14_0_20_39_18]PIY65557.1 MAG: aspartyl protease [Candidatus Shapirobacteria bacterium CG_4_10_14_0_8_um_filter_39_15]PJE68692.1 MAG: aspartyl protease [Candidatus Shapirobacteria bacterium CG10_big_fil_rev_8_21_14_0_10_38_8]
MGITQVLLKVKNPADPKKIFEGKFLVDSGASYTVVPTEILKKLGIQPQGEEEFSLADGKLIKRKVGSALYEVEGVERAAPVMFGQKGDSLLLGVFTLEALGLSFNPLTRKLYKAFLRM